MRDRRTRQVQNMTGWEAPERQTQYNLPASSVRCVLEPRICPSLGGQNLLRISLGVVEIDTETRFIFPWCVWAAYPPTFSSVRIPCQEALCLHLCILKFIASPRPPKLVSLSCFIPIQLVSQRTNIFWISGGLFVFSSWTSFSSMQRNSLKQLLCFAKPFLSRLGLCQNKTLT